jgi:hypothetical protein
MLQWFRARARGLAAGVLCSLATVGALSLTEHEFECDDASEGVFRVHDPGAHRVGVPSSDDRPPLHCLLCHWAQSFRADGVRDSVVQVASDTYTTRHIAPVRSAGIVARLEIPSRAPPA